MGVLFLLKINIYIFRQKVYHLTMKSIFVYNPESGNGRIKKYKSYILQELEKKYGEVECVETTHAGHAAELAKNAVGEYDYFFVAGGDGTLNEIVNGMGDAENKPIIGYIPSGTVNDISRSLGISRNIKKAVKNLITGTPFSHDIFKVNKRYGIYVCASGLFTKSSYITKQKEKRAFGKIAYIVKGIKEIKKAKPLQVKLTIDDEEIVKSCGMILIFNSRSVAGLKLNKRASLSDGKVEICLFHCHKTKITFVEIFRIINMFLFGIDRFKHYKHVTYRTASAFNIEMEEGAGINLDGEKSDEGSFNCNVISNGIQIIAPNKAKNKDEKRTTKLNKQLKENHEA